MIEKNIDHLNLDLDSDGELERYNLQDKRVDDLEALKNLDYVLSSGVEAPTNFKEVIVGNYDYTELDGLRIDSSANSTCKALIKKLCAQYTNKEHVLFKGGITKDYNGYFEIYIDNTNDLDSNGLPKYSTGLYRCGSTAFYKCWTIDHAYSVANVTIDSVATQTQKGLMSADDKVKLDNINGICVNLLNPTKPKTSRGIECTIGENGSVILNGTATENGAVYYYFTNDSEFKDKFAGKTLRIVTNARKTANGCYVQYWGTSTGSKANNDSEYVDFEIKSGDVSNNLVIMVTKGATFSNFEVFAMLTTNLSATMEDYTPYTGDTGKLNSDLSNKQDKLTAGTNITIKNNIISASGGDSVIEIEYEDFEKLSDEEKNNGTTYYIKDLPPKTLNAEMIKYENSDVKSALDKNTSDISTLNRSIDTRNRDASSANIITFPDITDLRIKCSAGYVSGAIYGFMQNVGAFAVNIYGNGGNIGITDLQGNIVSLGLISVNRRTQDVGNELSINASNHFNGIFIGVSI